jgi:hypothetical protein
MKQYTASEFREQLSGALDRAERGEAVIIARRGWRLATSDGTMLDNLPSHLTLPL